MKISITYIWLVVSITPSISIGSNVFANENTEISLNQSIDRTITE